MSRLKTLIAIASHFELSKTVADGYEIFNVNSPAFQADLNNQFYSELSVFYDLWNKGFNGADVFGLVHYRRRFCGFARSLYPLVPSGLMGEAIDMSAQPGWIESVGVFGNFLRSLRSSLVPFLQLEAGEIESILSSVDIMLPVKVVLTPSVQDQYARCHCKDDLFLIHRILLDKNPDCAEIYEKFLAQDSAFMFNMFISRSYVAAEYAQWMFPILREFEARVRLSTRGEYQMRAPAFLAERLLNVFVTWKRLSVREVPVVLDLAYV